MKQVNMTAHMRPDTTPGQPEPVTTASQRGLLGTLTVAGVARPFAAALATGPAGLYQNKRVVNGITTRIGWIVLPDGTAVRVAEGISTAVLRRVMAALRG